MIARLLIGPLEIRREEISKTLVSHMESGNMNHPDILYFSFDSKLGIAEARKIKEFFSLKSYLGKGRAVVLEEASNLTPEAQNALLKTLEELPEHGLFIMGTDSESKLLPTVISRCQIINLSSKFQIPNSKFSQDIEKLLESGMEQRFEYVEKSKEREEFFHSLLDYFHQNLASHLGRGLITQGGGNVNFLKELLQAEQWQKQNVNLRAILEYLMLVMPKKV